MVDWDDDEELRRIVEGVPSSCSKDYGRPFSEIFRGAGSDFYRVDPSLFAPAVGAVNNVRTGSFFRAGRVNEDVLSRSLSLRSV